MGMTSITNSESVQCMMFLMSMAPADCVAPLTVLDAVADFDLNSASSKAKTVNDLDRAGRRAVYALRAAINSWLIIDRRACVALLGHIIGGVR